LRGPFVSSAVLRESAFLVEEALQPLGARRMPQLAQRLGFDLAYALARDVELLADFLERVVGDISMPKRMRSTFASRGVSVSSTSLVTSRSDA
jgi:hypothetical protein